MDKKKPVWKQNERDFLKQELDSDVYSLKSLWIALEKEENNIPRMVHTSQERHDQSYRRCIEGELRKTKNQKAGNLGEKKGEWYLEQHRPTPKHAVDCW